jgi:NAD(P)-dependent dehydrogenase (short-subunit alcohol dehydrogenase family)
MTLDSAYFGMKYQIAQMLTQGGGIIANTLSISAIRPMTTMATASYTAAKGGFIQLTRYLANSYATQNIRINGVAPGLVATDNLKAVLTIKQRQELARQLHPNKTEVEPWEIAEAFAYLCSEGAKSVTGVVLPIDGGMSAG